MKFFSFVIMLSILAQYAVGLAVPEAALEKRRGKGGGNAASSSVAAPVASSSPASGANTGDIQTSLTLDPSVIAPAFAQGQAKAAGEVNSLQSTNNFINFCAGKTITNGQQVKTGSCNPAPMGDIPSTANIPSSKFTFPVNMGNIAANTPFTISMAIARLQTGSFTNAQASYYAAPQQLNGQGQIIGHSHVVIEALSSITQTTVTDPTKFAFFLGLNAAAQNGILTADVTGGLPPGAYKLSSINSAANHQPVLAPVAQHGSMDDVVYFTVGGAGKNAGNGAAPANNGASASSSVVPPAASSVAAGGKGSNGGKGKTAGSSVSTSSSTVEPPANGGASSVVAPPASSVAAGGKGSKGGKGNTGSSASVSSSSVVSPAASSSAVAGGGGRGRGGQGGRRGFLADLMI